MKKLIIDGIDVEYRYVCFCGIAKCYAGDRNEPDSGTPKFCCRTGKEINITETKGWKPNIVGNQQDIVVTINHSVLEYEMGFIHQIEKAVDNALSPLGFARGVGEKGDRIKFTYYQGCQAVRKQE